MSIAVTNGFPRMPIMDYEERYGEGDGNDNFEEESHQLFKSPVVPMFG